MSNKNTGKILFICTPFFGYFQHIINEFCRIGFEVDYFNDRPSESGFVKGMIKLHPKLIAPVVVEYFNKIIKDTSEINYDIVLIINSKALNEEIIMKLKESHKNAYFIFYTWDAVRLYPTTICLLKYFDISYSFDRVDCAAIKELQHLPLFYSNPYKELGISRNDIEYPDRKYDVLSVCTTHPNRYQILIRMIPYLKKQGLEVCSYMFIERIQYIYNKLFIPEFRHAKTGEFQFKKLSEAENIRLLMQSKTVLDIPHSSQTGLTMRTLEALGSKRKLITFNDEIKKYDFYRQSNILIINDQNWNEIQSFLSENYAEIDEATYQRYNISTWLCRLLETWRTKKSIKSDCDAQSEVL